MGTVHHLREGRRRRCRLASVGTGAAATVGATTAATGSGGGITSYLGINNTDGPALRGVSLIPLKIDSEGFLKGVWPDEVVDDFSNYEELVDTGTSDSAEWLRATTADGFIACRQASLHGASATGRELTS